MLQPGPHLECSGDRDESCTDSSGCEYCQADDSALDSLKTIGHKGY